MGSSFTAFGRVFYFRGRADTPGPQFVGNSRVTGARSPPGTLRDLTTPSLGTARAGGGGPETPAGCARAGGSSRRRAAGLPGGRYARAAGWLLPAGVPGRFRAGFSGRVFGRRVCPAAGGGSGRRGARAAKKKPGFFLFYPAGFTHV